MLACTRMRRSLGLPPHGVRTHTTACSCLAPAVHRPAEGDRKRRSVERAARWGVPMPPERTSPSDSGDEEVIDEAEASRSGGPAQESSSERTPRPAKPPGALDAGQLSCIIGALSEARAAPPN